MGVHFWGQVQGRLSTEIPVDPSGEPAIMAGKAPSKEGRHLPHLKHAFCKYVREKWCTHLCAHLDAHGAFTLRCHASSWWHLARPASDGS